MHLKYWPIKNTCSRDGFFPAFNKHYFLCLYLFCYRVWIHCLSSVLLYEALGNLKPYPTVCDFNLIQSPKSSPTYLLTEVQSNLVSFCPVSNILKG